MAKITQYSVVNLISEAGVDPTTWNSMPTDEVVEKTAKAIESRGIRVIIARNSLDAVSVLKVIPEGAEVMNGSSTTLIEIGYDDLISENRSGWKMIHEVITAENNDNKRAELRRKSVASE